MKKTLREVTSLVGLTRKQIQKYEKAGFLVPHKENNGFKNIYSKEEMNILWRLRFYNEMGYTIPEISSIINSPGYDRKKSLGNQIKEMENKVEELQKLIKIAKVMYELGIDPSAFIYGENKNDISYDDMLELMESTAVNESVVNQDEEARIEDFIKQEDMDKVKSIMKCLADFKNQGIAADSSEVQTMIKEIHNTLSYIFSKSVMLFYSLVVPFAPRTEAGDELDEMLGDGFAEFLFAAVSVYQRQNQNNPVDMAIFQAVGNILELHYNKKQPIESEEISLQVKVIYDFFADVKYMNNKEIIESVKSFGLILASSAMLKLIKVPSAEVLMKVLNDALEYHCDRL